MPGCESILISGLLSPPSGETAPLQKAHKAEAPGTDKVFLYTSNSCCITGHKGDDEKMCSINLILG